MQIIVHSQYKYDVCFAEILREKWLCLLFVLCHWQCSVTCVSTTSFQYLQKYSA